MSKSQRVTIALYRGQPSYKKELKKRLRNIYLNYGEKIPMERLIEQGINLVLESFGEKPIKGRLYRDRNPEKSPERT